MSNKNDIPGVYSITNIDNGRRYIGSSIHIYQRWSDHKSKLHKRKHYSTLLQNDWDTYGNDKIIFEILENSENIEQLKEREQYWMDFYQSYIYGYNTLPDSNSWEGAHHSAESIRKMSVAATKRLIGWIMPEKHKIALLIAVRMPHSKERKEKKRGQGNPNAKLTNDDVARIKYLLSVGIKIMPISKEYNVSFNAIWEIQKGIKWGHIEPATFDSVALETNPNQL